MSCYKEALKPRANEYRATSWAIADLGIEEQEVFCHNIDVAALNAPSGTFDFLLSGDLRMISRKVFCITLFDLIKKGILEDYESRPDISSYEMTKSLAGSIAVCYWLATGKRYEEESPIIIAAKRLFEDVFYQTGIVIKTLTGNNVTYGIRLEPELTERLKKALRKFIIQTSSTPPKVNGQWPYKSDEVVTEALKFRIGKHGSVSEKPFLQASLNKLKTVELSVNGLMIEVTEELVKQKISFDAIEFKDFPKLPLTPKVTNVNLTLEQYETMRFNSYKLKTRRSKFSRRNAFNLTFEMIKGVYDFGGKDNWFTNEYFADTRGRVYPLSSGMNFSGSKVSKACFDFRRYKPINTKEGLELFKLEGAKRLGLKLTTEESLAWVESNIELIVSIGKDPVKNHPRCFDFKLRFIRWCIEYAKYISWFNNQKQKDENFDGLGFESNLAMSLDCRSSSLQHIAMLSRCKSSAKQCGLSLEADRDKGVYEYLLQKVKASLESKEECDKQGIDYENAQILLKMIDLALVKGLFFEGLKGSSSGYVRVGLKWYGKKTGLTNEVVDVSQFKSPKTDIGFFGLDVLIRKVGAIVRKEASKFFGGYKKTVTEIAKACLTAGEHSLEIPLPQGQTFTNRTMYSDGRGAVGSLFKIDKSTITESSSTKFQGQTRVKLLTNLIQALDAHYLIFVLNKLVEEGWDIEIQTAHDCFYSHADDLAKLRHKLPVWFVEFYDGYSLDSLLVRLKKIYQNYPEVVEKLNKIKSQVKGDLKDEEVSESIFMAR